MLASHSSTRDRFWRTFIVSIFMVLFSLPASLYVFYLNFPVRSSYSWARVHSEEIWGTIDLHRSYGGITIDYWGAVVGGLMIWLTLGTGPEARKIYRGILKTMGFGRIFPGIHEDSGSSRRSSARWSLLSGKAKKYFSGWSSRSTSTTLSLPISRHELASPTVANGRSAHHDEGDTTPTYKNWMVKVKTMLHQFPDSKADVELKHTTRIQTLPKEEEEV